jgi:hypothetical protein
MVFAGFAMRQAAIGPAGKPAADQTAPTGYIRPLTRAEEEEAAIAQITEVLNSNPDFQRCTSNGTSDSDGTHWKLREPMTK